MSFLTISWISKEGCFFHYYLQVFEGFLFERIFPLLSTIFSLAKLKLYPLLCANSAHFSFDFSASRRRLGLMSFILTYLPLPQQRRNFSYPVFRTSVVLITASFWSRLWRNFSCFHDSLFALSLLFWPTEFAKQRWKDLW